MRDSGATGQAVLNASLRSSVGLAEFRQAFSGRIASLAKTHTLSTDGRTQTVSFEGLLRTELEAYMAPGGSRVSLLGPPVPLPSELAVPVGMALHELTVNAIRHGALADPNGRLEVSWTVEESPTEPVLHWTWNEHDGPPVALPTREGFGMDLLKGLLTYRLKSSVDVAFDPDGLRVSVAVPLPGAI